jgi:hypothetical protein
MNAGFSNLDALKKHLLAPALVATDKYDTALLAVGLGVAAAIENYCTRKFTRATGTEIIGADRLEFLLPRYPVESLSKIELKLTEAQGWQELVVNDVITTIDLPSGIVHFAGRNDVGPHSAQVRFTYTGGYFWNTAEPSEAGYPSALPEGANALPLDLRLAWLMQCENIWTKKDKLGTGIASKPDEQFDGSEIKLSPIVKDMIGQFVRYNLV